MTAPGDRTNGAGAGSGPANAHPLALSARELQVLALLSHGKMNAEIAGDVVVAPATAARHVHNILNKLGMSHRAEAADGGRARDGGTPPGFEPGTIGLEVSLKNLRVRESALNLGKDANRATPRRVRWPCPCGT